MGPCCDHSILEQFDDLLHSALTIFGKFLSPMANLLVDSGVMVVRSMLKLAPLTLLAADAGTHILHAQILRNSLATHEWLNKSLAVAILPSSHVLPIGILST